MKSKVVIVELIFPSEDTVEFDETQITVRTKELDI